MKKVLKIVAIISMLLLTVFAGGCGKSQEEKYTEARNEFVALEAQYNKDYEMFSNKITKNTSEIEFIEGSNAIVEKFEKESKKRLETLTELAKGKLELTKDLEKLKEEYHKNHDRTFETKEYRKAKLEKLKKK